MINDFDFLQPKDLKEALGALSQSPKATPLAGGTNIMVNLKRLPLSTDLVVDISRLADLAQIQNNEEQVVMGPGVTFTQLLNWHPGGAVEELFQPMCVAFAGPLIRNLATLGGNLCDASPAADVSPPLLALDAEIQLASENLGERWLGLPDFFKSVRKTARKPDELVTGVRFPFPDSSTRSFYYKLGKRKADAISIVSVAIAARLQANRVEKVRIALGAVAAVAMRAGKAEQLLKGEVLTATNIAAAAAAAAQECRPIDDFRASAAYRRQMVEVLVSRGLQEIAEK